MCTPRPACTLLGVLLLGLTTGGGLFAGEQAATPPRPGGFQHFVTRRGDRLYDGEPEFRFVGANMPGLILPYDYTLALPGRMTLPTAWEQEDPFKTLRQMNARVVRLWNLPIRDPVKHAYDGPVTWHYVQGPGRFNEESFVVVDRLLALAHRYGVRVMFDFTAEYGDFLGGIGTYAAHRGKKREEFWTDPQLKTDYQATLRYVLGRTNTLTAVAYRDDPAILAWQFGNEMQHAPPAWLAEMAAYIKSLDRNHLVAETRHMAIAPQVIDPNIDLYTLGNEYNALYAEYLWRAKGQAGDWVSYRVPVPMESVKVAAFFPTEFSDLAMQVSADGRTFTPLQPQRKERRLPPLPGGPAGGQSRVLLEYEALVPGSSHFLRIIWNGSTELDRVEILHE